MANNSPAIDTMTNSQRQAQFAAATRDAGHDLIADVLDCEVRHTIALEVENRRLNWVIEAMQRAETERDEEIGAAICAAVNAPGGNVVALPRLQMDRIMGVVA